MFFGLQKNGIWKLIKNAVKFIRDSKRYKKKGESNMKLKKYFGQTVLIASLVMAFAMSANAQTSSLGRNMGTWTGGINSSKYVYSQIRDTKKDGFRLHGTVYAKDDLGGISKKGGHTSGVNTTIYVSRKATYKKLFQPNKAWYSGFYTTRVKGE